MSALAARSPLDASSQSDAEAEANSQVQDVLPRLEEVVLG